MNTILVSEEECLLLSTVFDANIVTYPYVGWHLYNICHASSYRIIIEVPEERTVSKGSTVETMNLFVTLVTLTQMKNIREGMLRCVPGMKWYPSVFRVLGHKAAITDHYTFYLVTE